MRSHRLTSSASGVSTCNYRDSDVCTGKFPRLPCYQVLIGHSGSLIEYWIEENGGKSFIVNNSMLERGKIVLGKKNFHTIIKLKFD